jgi:hypothetical protein
VEELLPADLVVGILQTAEQTAPRREQVRGVHVVSRQHSTRIKPLWQPFLSKIFRTG